MRGRVFAREGCLVRGEANDCWSRARSSFVADDLAKALEARTYRRLAAAFDQAKEAERTVVLDRARRNLQDLQHHRADCGGVWRAGESWGSNKEISDRKSWAEIGEVREMKGDQQSAGDEGRSNEDPEIKEAHGVRRGE